MRCTLRAEEMLRCAGVDGGRRSSPSAGRQTGARRNHGQIASHHASVTHLRVRSRYRRGSARSEFACSHGRERTADVSVVDMRQVRELRARMQRRDPAKAVEAAESVDAHHAEPSAITAPPRKEAVTRPDGQPSKAAPTSPAKAETPTSPESKERNIRRCPERTIKSAPHRSRPPRPRAPIPHPAPIVIRSPSPRLKANPRPAVVGFPDPVAIAVWNPAIRLVRHPDLTVVGGVFPFSIGIQVFGADVILVGMLPGGRFVDHAVAVGVPAIPIVALGSGTDLVLAHRRRSRAPSPSHQPSLGQCPAALRSRPRLCARSRSSRHRAELQRGTRHLCARDEPRRSACRSRAQLRSRQTQSMWPGPVPPGSGCTCP